MKIFVGADHQGFKLKQELIEYLRRNGHDVVDEGDKSLDPDDDFPQFAGKVVHAMQADDDKDARGILICSSGQGMCIAANRFKGIRAILGYNKETARSSRNDDDSNVLCLPAHDLNSHQMQEIVDIWLDTPFAGAGRFVRRIREMDEI